jgi:hypothetical protein
VRYLISALGVIAALGFIAASAYSNYLFSATIATTDNDLCLYRALAILAVTCNSLCSIAGPVTIWRQRAR